MTSVAKPAASREAAAKFDPGRRLQWLHTEADFANSPDFENEEEWRRGYEVNRAMNGAYDLETLPEHGAVKKREPIIPLIQRDPELFMAWMKIVDPVVVWVGGLNNEQIGISTTHPDGVRAVTDDPEIIHNCNMRQLFAAAVTYHRKPGREYFLRLLATCPDVFSIEQWMMLGHPESEVWSEEERLVLDFTYAIMDAKLTDEMFQRARAMWGVKGVTRRTMWIGQTMTQNLFQELNIADADKR